MTLNRQGYFTIRGLNVGVHEKIKLHQLTTIVRAMKSEQLLLQGAVGAHLSDLVALADEVRPD